jgi:ADP-heptose:LPS heptosyltransferase
MWVVVHQGALGDWVLTMPLWRALAEDLGGRLLLVTGAEKAQLAARLVPTVEAGNIEAEPWPGLWRHDYDGPAGVLHTAEGVISYVSRGGDAWASNVERLCPQAWHCWIDPAAPPRTFHGHVLDWQQHQLAMQAVTLGQSQPQPRLNPTGPIVVHPGSGGMDKCWPRERFEQLIARLRGDGLGVHAVLGEAELDRWALADLRQWEHDHDAEAVTDLPTLYDRLAGARAFVGNDAGPTHLAAQMGLPTLALFGPSHAKVWAPTGPRVRVLAPAQPEAMTWLGVDKAAEAVHALIA